MLVISMRAVLRKRIGRAFSETLPFAGKRVSLLFRIVTSPLGESPQGAKGSPVLIITPF